jgi:hypothetical protein
VHSVTASGISHNVVFFDPSLIEMFGLAASI